MKMKRLLALALAGVMTFSMAACGGGSEDEKSGRGTKDCEW